LAGGLIQVVVGIIAIVWGFSASAFYPAFMRKPRADEKPMAKWLGRTIFVVVGIWFILAGLYDLRHR
jgi:hypothetical protein